MFGKKFILNKLVGKPNDENKKAREEAEKLMENKELMEATKSIMSELSSEDRKELVRIAGSGNIPAIKAFMDEKMPGFEDEIKKSIN